MAAAKTLNVGVVVNRTKPGAKEVLHQLVEFFNLLFWHVKLDSGHSLSPVHEGPSQPPHSQGERLSWWGGAHPT